MQFTKRVGKYVVAPTVCLGFGGYVWQQRQLSLFSEGVILDLVNLQSPLVFQPSLPFIVSSSRHRQHVRNSPF